MCKSWEPHRLIVCASACGRPTMRVSLRPDVVYDQRMEPLLAFIATINPPTRPRRQITAKDDVVGCTSGGPCNAGPSISDGMVFWGSGTFSGFGPKKVFAFGLP
jgi:hypothetical protein